MISSIIMLLLFHFKILVQDVHQKAYNIYLVLCAIEVLTYFKILFHFGDKYIKGDKRK